jgi:biopolymer transport protein TolR
MRVRSRTRRSVSDINVVPYIDVMLVLLVIFMITAPLLTQGVHINMPEADAKPIKTIEQTPIIVSVDKDGNYYLNINSNPDAPLEGEALATRVAAELAIAKEKGVTKHVLVKGDQDVNYGVVISAMTLLQRAGVDEIGLLTKPVQKTMQVKA